MKNSPFKIVLLLLVLVLILLPMQWMPACQIGSYEIKRVGLLADVLPEDLHPKDEGGEVTDMLLPALAAIQKVREAQPQAAVPSKPAPKGLVCIEDYADANQRGMFPFYQALAQRKQLNRPVRIAYFGDSFIEVDILTGALRTLLQEKFGGNGVGFLDIAPPYAANRSTVHQRYGGWNAFCVLDKGKYQAARLNIGQRYFVPQSTAWTEISGVHQPRLDTTEVHTLYLRANAPLQVGVKLNQGTMMALQAEGTGKVEALIRKGRSGRTRWQVPTAAGLTCWGVAEESARGVILDNLSLRGSSGTTLTEIPQEVLRQLHDVRPYDLIVLQFGLNVANKKQTNYSSYAHQMKTVIEHLKRGFPEAGILLIGVGDREDRLADGELHTLPGIHSLIKYQQNLAAETRVAFWNLYEGMGGEGSIRRMAEAKPAEAGKDYTHINHRGGQRIARTLYKSLVYGYEQYQHHANETSNR